MEVDRLMLPKQRPGTSASAASNGSRRRPPPPQRDAEFDGIELAELRRRRAGFNDEESRVSYWRRIIQARLDLVRLDRVDADPVADLRRVLTDANTSRHRLANIDARPVDDIPPLPDLAELWQQMTPDDPDERAALVARLREAEERLSEYRHELHQRIDHVTGELIARYREEPALALTALNERLHGG